MSFLLFAGSIGLDVYVHECSDNGKTISLFVQPEDPCEGEKVVLEESCHSSCCMKPVDGISQDDCCSQSSEFYQLSSDVTNSESTDSYQITSAEIHYFHSLIWEKVAGEKKTPNLSPNPPPDKKGRDILIQNQVFII